MAFKSGDFKKTARKSGDERVIYPYQIRDDRYTAALSYAIAYYERMIGRERREFEADTLLEFFGDPRLARGLVACLTRSYAWHTRTLADELGSAMAAELRRRGVVSPFDVRRRLYGLANGRYGGFILPAQRPEALALLCEGLAQPPAEVEGFDTQPSGESMLALLPEQVENIIDLDSEPRQVLVKVGPTPTPEALVARYNYHSLETALRRAEWLKIELRGPIWSILRSAHRLARRYQLRYEVGGEPRTLFDEQLELTIHGERSALGDWVRSGHRLVRLLLRLLMAHPGALIGGEASVVIDGQRGRLRLDERALLVLGEGAREAEIADDSWEEQLAGDFRRAWGRAVERARARGWRLRSDPEPLVGRSTLVMPDFLVEQGPARVAICLAPARLAAVALMRDLGKLGSALPAIVVAPSAVAETLGSCPAPLLTYDDDIAEAAPALLGMLERRFRAAA
jgi:predicted nuclease of restriction endonuclease-like RecB superfamily